MQMAFGRDVGVSARVIPECGYSLEIPPVDLVIFEAEEPGARYLRERVLYCLKAGHDKGVIATWLGLARYGNLNQAASPPSPWVGTSVELGHAARGRLLPSWCAR